MFSLLALLQAAEPTAPVVPVSQVERSMTAGPSVLRADVAVSADPASGSWAPDLALGLGMGLGHHLEIGLDGLPLGSNLNLAMLTPDFYLRTGTDSRVFHFAAQAAVTTSWPLVPDRLHVDVSTRWNARPWMAVDLGAGLGYSLQGHGAQDVSLPVALWFQPSPHVYGRLSSGVIVDPVTPGASVTRVPATAALGVTIGHDGNGIADVEATASLPSLLSAHGGALYHSDAWTAGLRVVAWFDPKIRKNAVI